MELPLAGVPRRRAVGAAYRRAPNHRHSLAPRGRKQSRLRRQARTGTEAADTNHRRTQWQAGTGTGTVGLKAARDFVEGARRNDPKLRELWAELNSPSERVGRTNAMQPMSGRSNPSVRIMQFETTSVSPDASLPSIASRSACGVVPSRCSARMPDLIISLVI